MKRKFLLEYFINIDIRIKNKIKLIIIIKENYLLEKYFFSHREFQCKYYVTKKFSIRPWIIISKK